MIHPFLTSAASGPRHRVLFLSQYPVTLGHAFLLRELECEEPTTFEDLLLFTFVCAHSTAAEARRDLSRWWCPWFFRLWGWRCRRLKLDVELEKIREFIGEQYSVPAFRVDGDKSREVKSPERWRLLKFLMVDCHLDRAAALATPMAFARTLWVVHAEAEGGLDVVLSERQQLDLEAYRAKEVPDGAG